MLKSLMCVCLLSLAVGHNQSLGNHMFSFIHTTKSVKTNKFWFFLATFSLCYNKRTLFLWSLLLVPVVLPLKNITQKPWAIICSISVLTALFSNETLFNRFSKEEILHGTWYTVDYFISDGIPLRQWNLYAVLQIIFIEGVHLVFG